MKVSELRELLATAPDDAEVLLPDNAIGDAHELYEVGVDAKAIRDETLGHWYVVHPDDQDDYDDSGLSSVVVLWY